MIKAFTLIELIVVLLISVIVINSCYNMYLIVENEFSSFETRFEMIEEISSLRRALSIDVESSKVMYSTDTRHLNFKMEDDSVSYLFSDSLIIRESSKTTRTFRLRSRFSDNHQFSDLPTNHFDLLANLNNDVLVLSFYKDYSAEQLLSLEYDQR